MKTRLLSVFLSILIITSLFCPVVAADRWDRLEDIKLGGPEIAVFAIPEVTEIVIDGLIAVFGSACVMKIGQELGIRWDDFVKSLGIVGETEKGNTEIKDTEGNTVTVREPLWKVKAKWDNYVSDVQNELDTVWAKQWVKAATHEGKAAIQTVYEYYTALGSPKGKDNKWYFEARRVHGEVEVNMKQLTEEQAVKKMDAGKDIMTLDEGLAKNVVKRFLSGGNGRYSDLTTEQAHQKTAGYYDHIHFRRHANERLHCWIWKNP